MSLTKAYYDPGSLHIEAYDSIYDPLPEALAGDVDFYLALAGRCGGPVLELGCGSGRVGLALALAGIETVGIDNAEEMLAAGRAKRASLPADAAARLALQLGDMRDFTLGRRFALAIVPFRTFHLLLSEAEQRQALAAIARHLAAGGRVALHLFDPPPDIAEPDGPDRLAREIGVSCRTGRRITGRGGACAIDRAAQVRRESWCYREQDETGRVLREQHLELALRWVWPSQMRALLREAGFTIEAAYGDFAGGPLRPGGEQIWVARR